MSTSIDDIVCVDSGSNDDDPDYPPPPKQRRGAGRGRRRGGRKQRGPANLASTEGRRRSQRFSLRKSKTSSEEINDSENVCTITSSSTTDFDDVTVSDSASHCSVSSSASLFSRDFNAQDVQPSTSYASEDVSCVVSDSLPVVQSKEPKKTARRGLAKKNSQVAVDSSQSSVNHNASVYSSCIGLGFKSIFHNTGLASAITEVKKPGLLESKEKKNPPENKSKEKADDTSSSSKQPHVEVDLDDSLDLSSDLLNSNTEQMDSSVDIRSPTPPPELSASTKRRRAKPMNKKLTSALRALDHAKGALVNAAESTPRRGGRGRGRKRASLQENDVVFLMEEQDSKTDMIVKVRYLSSVHRIRMQQTEPFRSLLSKLCLEIDEDRNNLGLYLHDKAVGEGETPKSTKLSVADILECHCVRPGSLGEDDYDKIVLYLQCKSKKTKMAVTVNKRQPLREVRQKYAELLKTEPSLFTLCFDGEDVDLDDTPCQLDMEDNDVIDVVSQNPGYL